MAKKKQVRELELFVASPGDLKKERREVDKVVAQVNGGYLRNRPETIVTLKWEVDGRTSWGEDPQSITNRQIADNCDAILVMFWGQVGTPTPRDISGTVEELNRAIARHKRSKCPHIMVYFKEAGLNPHKLDLDQLRKLRELREGLQNKGLHFYFDTLGKFSSRLHADLMHWLDNLPRQTSRRSMSRVRRKRNGSASPLPPPNGRRLRINPKP